MPGSKKPAESFGFGGLFLPMLAVFPIGQPDPSGDRPKALLAAAFISAIMPLCLLNMDHRAVVLCGFRHLSGAGISGHAGGQAAQQHGGSRRFPESVLQGNFSHFFSLPSFVLVVL